MEIQPVSDNLPKIKKSKIKLKRNEATNIPRIASGLADKLIAQHGLRPALVMARLIYERIYANYKRIEAKYGKVM